MSFSLGHSPWLLALCALAAAALTYWAYRRTTPPLPPGRKALLGGLRFLALAIILFLLFEPVVRRVTSREEPPVLAVLVDNSQSLRVTSGAATGDSLAGDGPAEPPPALRRALQSLQGGTDAAPRFFAFGRTLRALPEGRVLDSVRFSEARTDVAAALDGARTQLRGENVRGIVLVSDGQYNTGRNPLYLAERSAIPIHTIVVGDTTRRRDVLVDRVTTNELAYLDAALPVQVGVRADGYAGQNVLVVLARGGERLDAQQVRLPEGTAEVPVDLTYTPEEAGLQRLTVGVTKLDGEATYRNNTQTFAVRVLDSKRRVLLLGAAPTPDVSAVRQLLERGDDTEVTARISQAPGAFYGGALPDSLAAFDAAVLVGFPGAAAAPEAVRRVAEAASEGGLPLFFILSRQTDLGTLRDRLADALPAAPDQVRPGFVEAQFVPTPRSGQHPLFALPPEAAAGSWEALPPLTASQSRWQPSPDAEVLATKRVRGVNLDDPLLVVRRRAGQRSAALLGAGVWRWQNVPEGLDAAAPLWPALFSNALQWVSTPEDDRPVRVTPAQQTFDSREPVVFNGQVYDESLNPVPGASVQIDVTGPSGSTYALQMEAAGNGRYVARSDAFPEGTYAYTATAERGDVVLGTDRGRFGVGALTLEYRDTRADAALMRQIAQRSGGTFHTVEDAATLPAQLAAAGALAPLVVEEEEDNELWHFYGFLAAAVLLLGAEWFLRKRSGMV